MAEYTFKRLSDVEALAEVPEGANAFIEINGEIKKVPGEGLGGASGAGGVKTAIIKSSDYDDVLSYATAMPEPKASVAIEYECINMSFEEAYQTMANGEPLNCVLMFNLEGAANIQGVSLFFGTAMTGAPCLGLCFTFLSQMIVQFYWTADGLSTEQPGSSNPPV